MAFETPCHAVRLCLIDHRHVIDRTVATETTDAPVHMRCVIVINIIDRAMDPHPLDWVARFPAHPHRLQLWIVLLHLGMAVHAGLCIGHIRVRRHLHKTMAIPAIHSQLRDVNVVRKRHRLYRLITDFGIFWRHVIPRPCGQSTNDHDAANHEFRRQPIRPAWKKICHGYQSASALARGTRQDANKWELCLGCASFRRCKGFRLIARPRGNEDSINTPREGKINFVIHIDPNVAW